MASTKLVQGYTVFSTTDLTTLLVTSNINNDLRLLITDLLQTPK